MLAKRRTNRQFAILQHFKSNTATAADPVPAYPAVGLRGGRSGFKAWTESAVQPYPPQRSFQRAPRTVARQAGMLAFASGAEDTGATAAALPRQPVQRAMPNAGPNAGICRQKYVALQDAFQFQVLAPALEPPPP